MDIERTIARDYGRSGLERAILDALAAMGKDPDRLAADDLMGVDELHVGGRRATLAFTARLGLRPDMAVLDLGSGLGGPARCVAQTHGCRVTGIDLTPEFAQAAAALTRRIGLEDGVGFLCGHALNLPFGDGRFDAAYMISVGTNIADKAALFAGVRRILKPGGIFGVYDVMRINPGDLSFPLPWASGPATSFMVSPAGYRRAFEAAGFAVIHERDRRQEGLQYFRELRSRAMANGIPPLGLHLVMKDFAAKSINMFTIMLRELAAPTEMIGRLPDANAG